VEQDPRNGDLDPQQDTSSGDETTSPDLPALSAKGNDRRNFLKAAVVASAAVAAAGGVAGATLLAGQSPSPLIRIANFTQSGQCIDIKEGGKFSANNPNNFLQLVNSTLGEFGVDSGIVDPADSNSDLITLTRCGTHTPIYFKLVDKSKSTLFIVGTIVESFVATNNTTVYSHVAQNGGGDVFVAISLGSTQGPKSLDNQYPAHSCLELQCSGPFAPSPN